MEALVEDVRQGKSRAMVLRGEAGIGKTALLEHLVGSAPDLRVLRAAGVESEMELGFASLHQLCTPLLDRLERIPDPQRRALRTVFGLSDGAAPGRFLVGLAALSLGDAHAAAEAAARSDAIAAAAGTDWALGVNAQADDRDARRPDRAGAPDLPAGP